MMSNRYSVVNDNIEVIGSISQEDLDKCNEILRRDGRIYGLSFVRDVLDREKCGFYYREIKKILGKDPESFKLNTE